jgi:magnesium transporter
MNTVLVYEAGQTRRAEAVDPAWLAAGATVTFWVDIEQPDPSDARLLSDTFHFHELAIEDALSQIHHPKIESYDGFLYLILHGIVPGADQRGFATQDVDFFLGANYLVTVHHSPSRSIVEEQVLCSRHPGVLAEGPPSLLHRIVDTIVDHYRPEVDVLEERLESLERIVFEEPATNPLREILALKQDVASLRRITLPERDAVGRLARREFPQIPDALAYRFRDVFDHLVNLTDEAVSFQDRVTGLLDAYLSSQSNRMNQVMKVLTVISTIFMPLTVLTGMYGMNVGLPKFPGGEASQFWWILGAMLGSSVGMLWMFRKMRWL